MAEKIDYNDLVNSVEDGKGSSEDYDSVPGEVRDELKTGDCS